MNRFKILRRSIGIIFLMALMTVSVFAEYTMKWQSKSDYSSISASSADVKCGGQLHASKYLVNTGETVILNLLEGPVPSDFMDRTSRDNTSAKYEYQGIFSYQITIEGKDYEVNSMDYLFSVPGDYQVRGSMTYQWQTNNEAFPKYYFKKQNMSIIIRVSDLEKTVTPGKPDKNPDDEEKETTEAALVGMVSHTKDWEKNRNQFNAYCKDSENEQLRRNPGVYWSGEKFCLSVIAAAKRQPSTIEVRIRNNPYETTLRRIGERWEGVLFDKTMIDRWGRDEPEILEFVFSADIDGSYCEDVQLVTVDNRHKYWRMHRKE